MSLEDKAKQIYFSALQSVLPKNFISRYISFQNDTLYVQNDVYDLSNKKLYLFGSGKASLSMAKALMQVLENKVSKGAIVTYETDEVLSGVEILSSTHPIPSQKSLKAGETLLQQMSQLEENDFYIYLLSGGSSSMIESLKEGICLEDLQETTKILLENSFSIFEINTLRKKLSLIKGGGLARVTKAMGIVLVISDVIGDDLQTIGSAPFLQSKDTVISLDGIELPPMVVKALKSDEQIQKINEPKHYILASNSLALNAAKQKAQELGFTCNIKTDSLNELATKAAHLICEDLKDAKPLTCNLYAGECLVDVKANGLGGRNQHLALLSLFDLPSDAVVLCAGTDGIDGNSKAAGAFGSKNLLESANNRNLDARAYLDNFDSFSFFDAFEKTIITGPTGTNVMDLYIALKE